MTKRGVCCRPASAIAFAQMRRAVVSDTRQEPKATATSYWHVTAALRHIAVI